ncbi:hypothetical protein VTI74DRAFT_11226 [Chaetomium olivicolor]
MATPDVSFHASANLFKLDGTPVEGPPLQDTGARRWQDGSRVFVEFTIPAAQVPAAGTYYYHVAVSGLKIVDDKGGNLVLAIEGTYWLWG